jgi:hypothetical protein
VLPVPSDANYCRANGINLQGKVIGECLYDAAVVRAVQWGAGGTGPTVLTSVDGSLINESNAARQNDSGTVIVNYLGNGGSAGFTEPAIWNLTNGNEDAKSIVFGSDIKHAAAEGIGNNGRVVRNVETSSGNSRSFHVPANSVVAVVDVEPEGGANSRVTALSKTGSVEGADAEDFGEVSQAIVESTENN